MNNEWITDRLPTYADARRINATHLPDYELYGEVWVWQGQYRTLDWELVVLGEPWQPITTPAPYVEPKRWHVHYCYHELKWCLQDVTAKHKTYFPTMTTNDADSAVKMQRLANAYQEVLP